MTVSISDSYLTRTVLSKPTWSGSTTLQTHNTQVTACGVAMS